MPALSKRAIASRAAGAIGAKKRQRLTLAESSGPDADPEQASASDIGPEQPSQDLLSSGAESDSDSSGNESGELSEEEDQRPMSIFPIGQPAEGWDEAERKAPGCSWSRVYKQKAYYHRNKAMW